MKKRILSLVLAAVLLCTLLPQITMVSRAGVVSGTCGHDLTWEYNDETCVLEIRGSGPMKDYSYNTAVPWNKYAESITEVQISKGATTIGENAFYGCKALTKVTIPTSMTAIGEKAFASCTALTELTVPAGVLTLGENAFQFCSGLTRVTLPKGLREIGAGAFAYCESLPQLSLPETVTEIGEVAFLRCRSLTSMEIPKATVSVGERAFEECSGITEFRVASGNTAFSASAGVLFDKAKTTLIACPGAFTGSYSVPSTVRTVADNAFYGITGLQSVTLPEGLLTIGYSAFSGCSALQNVELPASLIRIGEYGLSREQLRQDKLEQEEDVLYYENWALKALNYSRTAYALRDGTDKIMDAAFKGQYKMKTVALTQEIRRIPREAFYLCEALEEIQLPDSVTEIGPSAFQSCNALTYVPLPEQLEAIGDSAFCQCNALTEVRIPDSVTELGRNAFGRCLELKEAYVGDGVRVLEYGVFSGCSTLVKARLPQALTRIGDHALGDCRALETVNIPTTVTEIGNSAFTNCKVLSRITLPKGLKLIGDYAFNNTNLAEVSIPTTVTRIGMNAFSGTPFYTGIQDDYMAYAGKWLLGGLSGHGGSPYFTTDVASGTVGIGDYACVQDSGLSTLNLPASLRYIGAYSFYICENLKSVTIPKGVKWIGEYAFGYTHDYEADQDIRIEDFEIRGYNGTAAETYALENGFRFVSLDPLPAPTLSLSNVTDTGVVKLTWNAVGGAVNYQIFRATSKTGTYKMIKETTARSFLNTSGKVGTTYYYKVCAVSEAGVSGTCSSVCSGTRKLPNPSITAIPVPATGKPKVSWSAVDGAVSYKVYRADSSSGTYKLMKTVTDGTSYVNTGAKPGETWYYKVKAIHTNSAADSAFSGKNFATCTLPQPTVSGGHVASTGKNKLTWAAVDGAKEYKVYRSASKDSGYKLMKTTTELSYVNTGAEAGETWYYKVMAVHDLGSANSAYSAVKTITCDLARPVVTIALSSGKPKLTWKKITGAKEYKVYRSTSKDSGYKLMKTTTTLSYTNTGAEKGKTYYYKVMAVHKNSAANSAYSSVKSIKATK